MLSPLVGGVPGARRARHEHAAPRAAERGRSHHAEPRLARHRRAPSEAVSRAVDVAAELAEQRGGCHDQRRAAGLERRMSYISRSVEKAAQEQDIAKAHQQAKQQRAATNAIRMGLNSALTSQVAAGGSLAGVGVARLM